MDGPITQRPNPWSFHGPLVLAAGLAALLLVVRMMSPGIPEPGDGAAHYLHARYFWQHAEAALSQWGKPLFSLLASPFALMGPWGTTLFNAICATATCAVIMAIIRKPGQRAWAWAVPIFLFMVPVYVQVLVAGMTEVLFGLCCTWIILLLRRHRHAAAMAATSLLPFVRPEYVAFAPCALLVVMLRRDFRALPWLLAGPVLYSVASGLLLGQPWALATDRTYLGKTLYGRGDPWLFVDNLDSRFGVVMVRILMAAVAAMAVLIWRDKERRKEHLRMALLTLVPAVAIFALHSFAWYRGGLGSMGLLRVVATTVPLLVLFAIHAFAALWRLWIPVKQWSNLLLGVFCLFTANTGYHELVRREPLPVPVGDVEPVQRRAAETILQQRKAGERLAAWDPLIFLLTGTDPWDADEAVHPLDQAVLDRPLMRPGDWIVWDAHFAANEGRMGLDALADNPRFHSVAAISPDTPTTTLGGGPYSIHLFQRKEDRSRPEAPG